MKKAILAVIAIFAVASLAIAEPQKMAQEEGKPAGGTPPKMQMKRVDPLGEIMTAEQKTKYAEIQGNYRGSLGLLQAETQKIQMEIGKLMEETNPDIKAINKKYEEMHVSALKFDKERAKMSLEVMALLTPEQRATLKQQQQQRMEQMKKMMIPQPQK